MSTMDQDCSGCSGAAPVFKHCDAGSHLTLVLHPVVGMTLMATCALSATALMCLIYHHQGLSQHGHGTASEVTGSYNMVITYTLG